MNKVAFVGSASGWGAQIRETEKGPETLRGSDLLSSLSSPWLWKETIFPLKSAQEIDFPPGLLTLPYIQDVCRRVAHAVEQTLQENTFPVVIGGDHVVAVGTWAGVVHHLHAQQKFGLIWVDAHMDAHTRETSPSQAYHGMPLAALLGYGDDALIHLLEQGSVLSPHHVCLIGVRSFEEGEAALLKRLGVRIYFMEEVKRRGFKTVLQEALQRVKQETQGFGLSIDLDGFDPEEIPGVGSPEPDGLKVEDVLPALSLIQNDPAFKALEIVEFNPDRDKGGKTLLFMRDLLLNLLPSVEVRP